MSAFKYVKYKKQAAQYNLFVQLPKIKIFI